MTLNEKLELVKEEALRKTTNICKNKSPFMTDIRK